MACAVSSTRRNVANAKNGRSPRRSTHAIRSALIRSAVSSLTHDGVLAACHWRHPVSDYPLSGDEVHAALRREAGLSLLAEHVEEDFRLDILVPPPAVSVARAERLVS